MVKCFVCFQFDVVEEAGDWFSVCSSVIVLFLFCFGVLGFCCCLARQHAALLCVRVCLFGCVLVFLLFSLSSGRSFSLSSVPVKSNEWVPESINQPINQSI